MANIKTPNAKTITIAFHITIVFAIIGALFCLGSLIYYDWKTTLLVLGISATPFLIWYILTQIVKYKESRKVVQPITSKIVCNRNKRDKHLPAGFSTIIGNNIIQPTGGIIYYHIMNFTPDLPKHKTVLSIQKAFDLIAEQMYPIQFKPTKDIKQAHIHIRFKNNGDPILPIKFDKGTLAYAFAPSASSLASTVWFNDELNWADLNKPKHIQLLKVAVHEFLHALNVGHTNTEEYKNDIMQPVYNPHIPIVFTEDTQNALKYLYGDIIKGLLSKNDCNTKTLFSNVFHSELELSKIPLKTLQHIAFELGIDYKKIKKEDLVKLINIELHG